jgi:hypothetical protein
MSDHKGAVRHERREGSARARRWQGGAPAVGGSAAEDWYGRRGRLSAGPEAVYYPVAWSSICMSSR